MKMTQLLPLLLITLAAATGCSKSEPTVSAPAAAPTPTDVASASAPVQAAEPAAPVTAPQPAPSLPVATFTPTDQLPAPMLPTRDSALPAVDEHGHPTATVDVRRIDVEEAAMLVRNEEAILLDVRSKEAFVGGHIKGAVNIPYGEIGMRARAELPPTRWIIPYCT